MWRLSGAPLTAALAVAGVFLLLVAAPLLKGSAKRPADEAAPAPIDAATAGAAPSATAVLPTTAAVPTAPPPATAVVPTAPPPTPASVPTAPLSGATAAANTPTAANVASATPTKTAPVDWATTLRALAAARDSAFTRVSKNQVAAADAPHTSAAAIDLQRVQALQTAGLRARGLSSTVYSATATTAGPDTATLRLREATSAYDLVDAAGAVVEHRQETAAATWIVVLIKTRAGWRTATATPAA